MIEPDFCEGQLQQMANAEIFNRLRNHGLANPTPIIIPPYWEDLWGWDSAIFLPCLGSAHPTQNGCNLFIQYKLSKQYSSCRAVGWSSWKRSFLRFNFGYQRNRVWDYTQRNHLIQLDSLGYTAIYVTNHVLDFAQLSSLANADQLCTKLPTLKISSALANHGMASFTATGTQFHLHSEIEKVEKATIINVIENLPKTELREDIQKIIGILVKFEEDNNITSQTINQSIKRHSEHAPRHLTPLIKLNVASYYLRHYLNTNWIRY